MKLVEVKGCVSVVVVNGMMLDLIGDVFKVMEFVEIGCIYLDGKVKIGVLDGIVCDWICMVLNGYVIVNVILDEDDEFLGELWVELMGLLE